MTEIACCWFNFGWSKNDCFFWIGDKSSFLRFCKWINDLKRICALQFDMIFYVLSGWTARKIDGKLFLIDGIHCNWWYCVYILCYHKIRKSKKKKNKHRNSDTVVCLSLNQGIMITQSTLYTHKEMERERKSRRSKIKTHWRVKKAVGE